MLAREAAAARGAPLTPTVDLADFNAFKEEVQVSSGFEFESQSVNLNSVGLMRARKEIGSARLTSTLPRRRCKYVSLRT